MRTQIAIAITLAAALSACGPNTTRGQLLQHFDQIEAEAEDTHEYIVDTYNEYEADFQELAKTCPERLSDVANPGDQPHECKWSTLWNVGRRSFWEIDCQVPDRHTGCTRREYVEWMIEATEPDTVRSAMAEAKQLIEPLSNSEAKRRGINMTRNFDRLHRPCIEAKLEEMRNHLSNRSWRCHTDHVVSMMRGLAKRRKG